MSIYSNRYKLDKQQKIQIYHYDNNNHLPRQNKIHAAKIKMQIITLATSSKSTAVQCIIIFKSYNGSFRKYS